jgi:hypothetical protein
MKILMSKSNVRVILLLYLLVGNFQDVCAQEGTFKPVDRLLISNDCLDAYLLELRNDTLSRISVTFITLNTNGASLRKIDIHNGIISYLDDKSGLVKKKKCKKSIKNAFKKNHDIYFFEPENRRFCDQTQLVVFKEDSKEVILFSFSCQLHNYFFSKKHNTFNIDRKIFNVIQYVKPLEIQ